VQGKGEQGAFDHIIDAKVSSVGFTPLLAYQIQDQFAVKLGGTIGLLTSTTFHQKEEVAEPKDRGTFLGGSRVRNEFDSALPNASSLRASLDAIFSYALPLNKSRTSFLVPEVSFSLGLTNLTKDLTWKAHSIRGGFAVVHYFNSTPSVIDTVKPPAVVQELPRKDSITLALSVTGISADRRDSIHPVLRIEEYRSSYLQPLLNYIFFEEKSGGIPNRYVMLNSDGTDNFSIPSLSASQTLTTYHHLLNIVGKRLQENPAATITLTGTTAGVTDGDATLAKARAENVKAYLTDIWKVDSSRISVVARALPERPSPSNDPDGIAENRRVEITSNDDRILAPVLTESKVTTLSPDHFEISARVLSGKVSSSKVSILKRDRVLQDFPLNKSHEIIDWKPRSEEFPITGRADSLLVLFKAEGSELQKTIPIEEYTRERKQAEGITDKEVERYSLILFDFNQSELGRANQAIVDLIKSRITSNATISVTGYTDRVGEENYNQKLSEERARVVARALSLPQTSVVRGLGESQMLYSNDLPEGRFYSRTVIVEIEKSTAH